MLKRGFFKSLVLGISFGGVLLMSGCGNGASTVSMACTASATLASGATTAANSTVSLTNLMVNISNGTGPFSIAAPGISTATSSSTSYSYPSTFSSATDASGIPTAQVTVTDTSDSKVASCIVSTNATSLTGGTTTGTVGATTGNITMTPYPSASASLGQQITLTVTDTLGVASPTFSFTASGQTGVTVQQQYAGSNIAIVTNTASTVSYATITVYEYAAGSTTAAATGTITLGFGSGTVTTGTLTCVLTAYGSGSYFTSDPVYFLVTATSGTASSFIGSNITIGEPFRTTPPASFSIPFNAYFYYTGSHTVSVVARDAVTGIPCNGGAPLTATVQIYYRGY